MGAKEFCVLTTTESREKIWYQQNAFNKGADQTVWMCRLIWAFVLHKQQSLGFSC